MCLNHEDCLFPFFLASTNTKKKKKKKKPKKPVSVSPINNPLGLDFRQREICSTSDHKLYGKESPKEERSSLRVIIESDDYTDNKHKTGDQRQDRKVFHFVPFNLLDLGAVPSLEPEPAAGPWLR